MAEEKEVALKRQIYMEFDTNHLNIAVERSDVSTDMVYLELDDVSIVIEVHESDVVVHDDDGGRRDG